MGKPGSNVSPSPGIPIRTPRTVGDGKHSAGSGGTNQDHLDSKNFPGSGIRKPPTTDGHSAGQDGVVEGKVNVPRTRIMGQQDPVDGKR